MNPQARYAEAWKRACVLVERCLYRTGDPFGLPELALALDELRKLYGDPNKPIPQGVIDAQHPQL